MCVETHGVTVMYPPREYLMTPCLIAANASTLHSAMRDGHGAWTQSPQRRVEDRQFATMEHAYRQRGGLASGDAVARLLRRHSSQPLSLLARWVVDRQIISLRWQSELLVPMFQFEATSMHPRAAVLEAVNELSPILDDWNLACWFAEPNARLDHCVPVDVIDTDPDAVRRAARADRQARVSGGDAS
jgi:hypothetical protein